MRLFSAACLSLLLSSTAMAAIQEVPEAPPAGYSMAQDARRTASEALQRVVVTLIDLQNQAKHLHWAISGPLFISNHEFLQDVADTAARHTDLLAERMTSLGFAPDARLPTVVRESALPELPDGWQADQSVLEMILERLVVTGRLMDEAIRRINEVDPAGSNKLQDAQYDIDKMAWFARAQLQQPGSAGRALPWRAITAPNAPAGPQGARGGSAPGAAPRGGAPAR